MAGESNTDPKDLHTGGCLCGAVRYEARGEPLAVGYCHCESCRRHTGAPVVAYVGFKADQLCFSGQERSRYVSSPGVRRAFCGRCGTPLTWEGYVENRKADLIELHIATLDHPERYRPEDHSRYAERIAWFDVADTLPRHR